MKKLLPFALLSTSLILFSCSSTDSKTEEKKADKASHETSSTNDLDARSEKAYINESELSEDDIIKTGMEKGLIVRGKDGKARAASHEKYKKPLVTSERLVKDRRTGRVLKKITPEITYHYKYDKNGKVIDIKRTPTRSRIFNPYSYDYTKKLEEFRTHSLKELTAKVKNARSVDLPAIIEALSFKSKKAAPVLVSLLNDTRSLNMPVHTKSLQPQFLWIDGLRGNEHIVEKIQVRTWAAYNLQILLKTNPFGAKVEASSDYYFAFKGAGKEKKGLSKKELVDSWLSWWDLNSEQFK